MATSTRDLQKGHEVGLGQWNAKGVDEHILRSRATGKSQRRGWELREKGNEQEGSELAEPAKPGHPPWGPWLVPEGGEHVSVEIVGVS